MPNIDVIADELTGDPLTRGYSGMTDQEATDDGNLKLYSSPVTATQVRDYLMLEQFKPISETGTNALQVYGRLTMVANAAEGGDPFGGTGDPLALTNDHIASAITFKAIIDAADDFELDLNNSDFDRILTDIFNGKVLSAPHRTAIKAMSDDLLSRWEVLRQYDVAVGHIIEARS